jgi:hypothetical protein
MSIATEVTNHDSADMALLASETYQKVHKAMKWIQMHQHV